MSDQTPVDAALAERNDLDIYASNKRLLFALQLDYEIEDVHAVAQDALTDGGDDKACDLVYVDRDVGEIVIGQGYESVNPEGRTAPASKAASLHQAVSWLLAAPMDELPERLRDAATEVRDALNEKRIQQLRLWFVHNCDENDHVVDELKQAAVGAKAILDSSYSLSGDDIDVVIDEVGPRLLASWYEGAQTPILVREKLELPMPNGLLRAAGDNWRSVCVSVPATWLHGLFAEHGADVFSANVRGYLGSIRSEKNINHGIKESAAGTPKRFWAYNNGVTAVVNDWEVDESADPPILNLSGIAIVNGAQTTGALGSVNADDLEGAEVLARFIKCDDLNTVREIIRFNNRQNPTQAADFRSNDRVQRRLRDEFAALGVVDYSGGRRGGSSDVIKRPAENMIAAPVAAQALAAFHGTPSLAYHEKGKIWEDDTIYGRLFSDRTTARHIMFVITALKSIEQEKSRLRSTPDADLDDAKQRRLSFLRRRGSQFLLLAGLGACSELLVGRAVPDRYALGFKQGVAVSAGVDGWAPVVDAVMPLAGNSLDAALQSERGLRSDESVRGAIETFRALVESVQAQLEPTFEAFRSVVDLGADGT